MRPARHADAQLAIALSASERGASGLGASDLLGVEGVRNLLGDDAAASMRSRPVPGVRSGLEDTALVEEQEFQAALLFLVHAYMLVFERRGASFPASAGRRSLHVASLAGACDGDLVSVAHPAVRRRGYGPCGAR